MSVAQVPPLSSTYVHHTRHSSPSKRPPICSSCPLPNSSNATAQGPSLPFFPVSNSHTISPSNFLLFSHGYLAPLPGTSQVFPQTARFLPSGTPGVPIRTVTTGQAQAVRSARAGPAPCAHPPSHTVTQPVTSLSVQSLEAPICLFSA